MNVPNQIVRETRAQNPKIKSDADDIRKQIVFRLVHVRDYARSKVRSICRPYVLVAHEADTAHVLRFMEEKAARCRQRLR